MKERIGQRIETELAEFKTDFLERHLCSDPDNDIRKTTLELITEKAQLSKLHTKYAKNRKRLRPPQRVGAPIVAGVERCHTRPANQTYPCENQRFRQFAEDTENLMKQISELQQLRSRLAKHMGERVIIP